MILRRLVVAVLLLAAPAAYAADDGLYLFDLLKQPAYLSAWKAMLAGESVPSCKGRGEDTASLKCLEDTLNAQRLEGAKAAG